MFRVIIVFLVAAATSHGSMLAQGRQGEIELQRAIRTETLGDLKAAVGLYAGIAHTHSGEPAIAVQALIRMAECLELLGEPGANAAYAEVVARYPTERAAALASARLQTARGEELRQRRLVTGDPAGTLQLSGGASLGADGRTLAVIDWYRSGDVAVQDIASGTIKRLMVKAGTYSGDATGATANWTMLSPDQRQVAFSWTTGFGIDNADEQLRVADVRGGASRVLASARKDDHNGFGPAGWAPDARSVFVVIFREEGAQLSRVWLADGRVQPVRTLGRRTRKAGGGGSRPAVSPDGKFIAYAALAEPPEGPSSPRSNAPEQTSIYVTAVDGSGPEVLIAGGGGTTNQYPMWTPDGSHLLFLSDRPVNAGRSVPGLWWVENRNGHPTGPPSPAWPDVGRVLPLGITRAGALYYLRERTGDDVFTMTMNWNGPMNRPTARRLTDAAPDANLDAVWSPDGRNIAFKRRAQSGVQLIVRSVATGQERGFSSGFVATDGAPLVWTPDGAALLSGQTVRLQGSNEVVRLLRLDVVSGTPTTIDTTLRVGTFAESRRGIAGGFSRDGRTLYTRDWEGTPTNGVASIVALDLTTGGKRTIWSRQLSDSRLVSQPAVSPDGSTLAFVVSDESGRGHVARVGVDGSQYRELVRSVDRPERPRWAQGGRTILFVQEDGGSFRLMKVPAEGGRATFTGFAAPDRFSFDLSPDETQLLFSEHYSNELWSIENVSALWASRR
jgi:Tol biopolymer transport system component